VSGLKQKALYSRAGRRRIVGGAQAPASLPYEESPEGPGLFQTLRQWLSRFATRHDRSLPAALAVLLILALWGGWQLLRPAAQNLTQWDIDNAVKYTLSHTPPAPADSAIAANEIAPSVVRVDGYLSPEHAAALAKAEAADERKNSHDKSAPKPVAPATPDGKDQHPDSTGSGVVVDEQGDILTNLHVIHSTDRWVVTFADGSTSDARVVSVQPENDLAVIHAEKTPDEIKPATLASTRDLNPGDTVVAVGFPFGIGPSVSSGVVAGLKRAFVDPDHKPTDEGPGKLSNLIQFDAAVNPGNSGGPLVNRDGEVVGIVTAIYNPTGQRVFAGMAFAVPIESAASAVAINPL
jgi:serine protease DegQ